MQSRTDCYKTLGFPDDIDPSQAPTLASIKTQYQQQMQRLQDDKRDAREIKLRRQKLAAAYKKLVVDDYIEEYRHFSFIDLSFKSIGGARSQEDEVRQEKLNHAYQSLQGGRAFFNRVLSAVAAIERFVAFTMLGAVIAAGVLAFAAVALLPAMVCALVAPEKLGLPGSSIGWRAFGFFATPLALPVAVLVAAVVGVAAPVLGIATTPNVYKEYAIRGMNGKEKASLFLGVVMISSFFLGIFPPAGMAAAFGMASLNPMVFQNIFGALTFLAAKLVTHVVEKVHGYIYPAAKKQTASVNEPVPGVSSAGILAALPVENAPAPVVDASWTPEKQMAVQARRSSQIDLNLIDLVRNESWKEAKQRNAQTRQSSLATNLLKAPVEVAAPVVEGDVPAQASALTLSG